MHTELPNIDLCTERIDHGDGRRYCDAETESDQTVWMYLHVSRAGFQRKIDRAMECRVFLSVRFQRTRERQSVRKDSIHR